MPEFLRRPETPNALAQTLVQLASAQTDPLAEGLKTIGKLADTYTAQQQRLQLMKEENDLREKSADAQHGRAKELKKMDMDAAIFEKLLSSDRIIAGMLGNKGGEMTGADASRLLDPEAAKSKKLVEADFGAAPPAAPAKGKGTKLSAIGVNIPGDPSFTPSKETVEVDAEMAKKYKLPQAVVGKTLSMDQLLKLRGQDEAAARRAGAGGRDPDRLNLARKIVMDNPDMIEADQETRLAAIDQAYDSLGTIKGGGTVAAPPAKPAPEKKKGLSIFGFNFGGGESKPSETAAPPKSQPKLSRQALLDKLKKKGYGNPGK